jgi:hypothetical protein
VHCQALRRYRRLQRTIPDSWHLARLDKTDWAETGPIGVPVTISGAAATKVARAVVSFAVAMRSD